ncbi:hypothetical protein Tco_0998846 [Tanacetum coccineum]
MGQQQAQSNKSPEDKRKPHDAHQWLEQALRTMHRVDGPLICQSYVRRGVNDHPLTLTPEFGPGVTPGARLTRVVSLCVEQDAVLAEDTIVERKTSSTRRGERKSYRIGRKGQRPSASKWFSKEVGEAQFPHLHF